MEDPRLIRMRQLVDEVNEHAYRYYVMDDPIISDAQWDKLFDELRDLEKETGTILPDSPSLRVGGTILEAFTPHTHLGPLWSMDKPGRKSCGPLIMRMRWRSCRLSAIR